MEKGLSKKEVEEIFAKFGKNTIQDKKSLSSAQLFLSQFPSFINCILFLASLFSFFIRNYIDGSLILVILILSASFSFLQEYRAEKELEKLKNLIAPTSRVLRDGKEEEIPSAVTANKSENTFKNRGFHFISQTKNTKTIPQLM